MVRWICAAVLLAAAGCALRPPGEDQDARSIPIKIRVRVTPCSRVASVAELRNAVLKVAHVTAVNVIDFGQVADDNSDGTLPVYELQCGARTADVSLPRIFEAVDAHGYEVTDLLVQVRNEDDAFTLLLDSLGDYARTRAIALSADWLPVRAADGMPEVRSLSRMGERATDRVMERLAKGFPRASDETAFLYAYILEKAGDPRAVGPLHAFLKTALESKGRGEAGVKYARSLDMAALALQTLVGLPKIDFISWNRDREMHFAEILTAADGFLCGRAVPPDPHAKAKPAKAPPSLH